MIIDIEQQIVQRFWIVTIFLGSAISHLMDRWWMLERQDMFSDANAEENKKFYTFLLG